jgi:predicted TPR repeat methyltransferase
MNRRDRRRTESSGGAEAINSLGVNALAGGNWLEAGEHFRRALAVRPNYAEAACNLALVCNRLGRHQEAIALCLRAVALNPKLYAPNIGLAHTLSDLGQIDEATKYALAAHRIAGAALPLSARYLLGKVLTRCGLREEAISHLRMCLLADPSDSVGAGMALALLGERSFPERAPDEFIQRMYGEAAAKWGDRKYFAPQLVAAKVVGSQLDILDAGCGTGLVGRLVRKQARQLVGVDLSEGMIEQARRSEVYDELIIGDLVFVLESGRTFDVVTCAATLIHFGDLTRPLLAVAAALRPGGLFVATAFPCARPREFSVAPDTVNQIGFFTHGRDYVARTAGGCGLSAESIESAVHEYNRFGAPVESLVITLRKA